MIDLTSSRSPLFFEGPGAELDAPEVVNRALYGATEWRTVLITAKLHFSISTVVCHSGGVVGRRQLRMVLIDLGDGRSLRMPWYQSQGMATPDASPKGTWWPTCGLYTAAYCDARRKAGAHVSDHTGHIGKYYQALEGVWVHHNKEVDLLPAPLRVLQEVLGRTNV